MLEKIRNVIDTIAENQKAKMRAKVDAQKAAIKVRIQKEVAKASGTEEIFHYKQEVLRILGDLNPTPKKFAAMHDYRATYSVDPTGAQKAHHEIFRELVVTAVKSGRVAREHLDAFEEIRDKLGADWTDVPRETLLDITTAEKLACIAEGRPPVIEPSTTELRPLRGEDVHLEIPSDIIEVKTFREHTRGHGGHVSFRIAKGVYYRPGGTRGHTITHTEAVTVASGTLSITSKRIAFIGHSHNFAATWEQILHAEPMEDGLELSLSNRKNSILIQYRTNRNAEVVAALLSHYLA